MSTTRTPKKKSPKFHVPAPVESAFKAASERVDTLTSETKVAAAKMETKVRAAADRVRKSGEEIAKDPKTFVENVVRDGREKAEDLGKGATKLADDVAGKLAKAMDKAVQRTLHRFNVPTHRELQALTSKVDELGKKIDSLKSRRPAAAAKSARPRARKKASR